MWTATITALNGGKTLHYAINTQASQTQGTKNQTPTLNYGEAIQLWQRSQAFRAFFMGLLKEAPFEAYFWETPSLTQATVTQPFEFVLVESLALSHKQPNPHAFNQHFTAAPPEAPTVTFANLGRDATLVVPCPQAIESVYTHIAQFTRQAPDQQQQVLWQQVGLAITQKLGPNPIWVSTSGLGIFWLHVRLDNRPKYYTYAPYRQ